jgi:putative oxidoreductase
MNLLRILFSTTQSKALIFLRLSLGLVILPHGLQKTLGLFGGGGFQASMDSFTTGLGIPFVLALAAILAESLGAIGLITGTLTRLSAFGIAVTMTVAALMEHVAHGFFMNWYGAQAGEGYEFHILAVGSALTLMFLGGGGWSVDRWIATKIGAGSLPD